MREYTVIGTVTCTVSIIVAANSEEEAEKVATDEFGGVMAYCGNGGTGKLIGVSGENEAIQCDDDPCWDYVEEGSEIDEEEYE